MNKSNQENRTAEDLYKIKANMILDLRGVSCPLPPLKTVKALKTMQAGEILEVLGTSPMGKKSSPLAARTFGNEFLGSIHEDGFYRFFVRKA